MRRVFFELEFGELGGKTLALRARDMIAVAGKKPEAASTTEQARADARSVPREPSVTPHARARVTCT